MAKIKKVRVKAHTRILQAPKVAKPENAWSLSTRVVGPLFKKAKEPKEPETL